MEQEKRTDKTKKTTFGGFFAVYKRWDSRGKSSKELKLMIEDLKNALTHQLVRIRKLKAVIELKDERENNKLKLEKLKLHEKTEEIRSVEKKLDRRDNKIADLDFIIKAQDKEISRLDSELDKTEHLLVDLKSQPKKVITKEVKVQLTPEAKRLQRIADKGVTERTVNTLEYTTRTLKFLKNNNLSLEYLSLIIEAELLGNVKTKDISATYKVLNRLVELGYFQTGTGFKGSSKYWFVSLKGKQLLKDYKNYLSYGRSILTT